MEDKLVNDVAMITCPVCWAAIKDKDNNWTRHRKWHESQDAHHHPSPFDLYAARKLRV